MEKKGLFITCQKAWHASLLLVNCDTMTVAAGILVKYHQIYLPDITPREEKEW